MIRSRQLLGITSLLMTVFYLFYLIIFFAATVYFYLDWKQLLDENQWRRLEELKMNNQTSIEYEEITSKFKKVISFLSLPSHDSTTDMQMIADGFFTLSIVISIIHSCIYFFDRRYAGPLLVSLIITSKIIPLLFLFFLITLAAYQTSCLHLFTPYMNDLSYGIVTNRTSRAYIARNFNDLRRLTIYVFFSLFGIVRNELTQNHVTINLKNLELPIENMTYHRLNTYTSTVGSIIYGFFAFSTRIVYLTIIIAYTKRVYGLSMTQATENWLYTRTKIVMAFICQDMDILPVPFNIIPSPRHILQCFRRKVLVKKPLQKIKPPKTYLRNLHGHSSERRLTSDDVINRLVLRFLTKYHPLDAHSYKRQRQIQYREELSAIRQSILDEIQLIHQNNQTLKKHISTVFFDLK